MTLITKYANALNVGPSVVNLTIYRKGRGPLFSIEAWSNRSGTTLTTDIAGRQVVLFAKVLRVREYKTRIFARRYYLKGN